MRDITRIADELFNKIRSRFENVALKDEKSNSTENPEEARFVNFNYISKDGKNFGNITISLLDEQSLKVVYSKNITDKLNSEQQTEWFNFLRDLRHFAKRNILTFDVRDIGRSGLKNRDLKQQTKAAGTLDTDDMQMLESRLFGTSRSSYQDFGPVRIIVRHHGNVDDTKRGDRSRHIEALLIQTPQGERRLLPFKNLSGARALAQHYSQGGNLEDEIGKHICGMCNEMASMAHFVRSTKKRLEHFEDRETGEMAKSAINRYTELKNKLKAMSSKHGYTSFVEGFQPEAETDETIDIDALKERFVRKLYDERFTEALPYVYRAHKNQQACENSLLEEFESWLNEISEETFDVKQTSSITNDTQELDDLMKKPIEVGQDALNTQALRDAIEDVTNEESSEYEKLFDSLKSVADAEGDDSDARPTVIEWLRDHSYTEMAEKYESPEYTQDTTGTVAAAGQPSPEQPPAPGQPDAQATAGASTQPTGEVMPGIQTPVSEELDLIRKLAGLK